MTTKKLTAAQKRDRDTAALIASIQEDYEAKIARLEHEHGIELAKSNTENYVLGLDQGYRAAEAAYQAQGIIDRLLKKGL